VVLAPMDAPVEVSLRSVGPNSVFVKWRGVSTDQQEEPLEGYQVNSLQRFSVLNPPCVQLSVTILISHGMFDSNISKYLDRLSTC